MNTKNWTKKEKIAVYGSMTLGAIGATAMVGYGMYVAVKYSRAVGFQEGYACAKVGGKIIANSIEMAAEVGQSILDVTAG